MIGSAQDVKAEVKTRIGSLAPGGGYVLATSNNISSGVPIENVFTLFEEAALQGRYPIGA